MKNLRQRTFSLALFFLVIVTVVSCGGSSYPELVALEATVEAIQSARSASAGHAITQSSIQTPVVIVKEVIKEVPQYIEIEKEVIVEKFIEVVVTATPTAIPAVPPTVTPIPAPTSTPTPPPIGSSSSNPVAAGSTLLTGDGLGITVMSVNEDAWPEIQAENSFNDPPKLGNNFRVIEVRVQVVNGYYDATNSVSPYDFKAVGSSGIEFSVGGECGVVPNELNSTTMFQGAVIQGNLCVEVPETETDLQIYYQDGSYDSQKFWSKAIPPSSIELLRDVSAKVVTDSSVNIGTRRTNPAAADWILLTDDDLRIRVESIDADAWPEVQAANSYNDPPRAGNRFLMVRVEIENISGASGQTNVSHYDFEVVGSSAIWAGSCGLYPVLTDELDVSLLDGQKMSGNLCFEVGDDETDFILNYNTYWLTLGNGADK